VNQTLRASSLALALSIGWIAPAQAAAAQDSDVQAQLAAMQAQLERLNQRVVTLEGQLDAANARVIVAEQRATAAVVQGDAARAAAAAAPVPTVNAKPATEIAWDGAPRLSTKDGWSFKPRGRMQLDAAGVNAPDTIPGNSLGFGSEFRRVYLGFDGTMPGGFGYRVEADLANGTVDLTDVYLTYKASPQFTVTVGQHKPFQSLEDMTSDLFSSFTERAAFNSAFGFERRVGLSGTYAGKAVLVQAGVFADNAADLSADTNNSYSFDGRAVVMPKLGSSQLHLGGSYHVRDFNDAATTTRYRARPFVHTTDLRLVNTGNITSTGETGYGLEAAYIAGRFHATAESSWMRPHRPGLADPTFNGGYAELGYLLTADSTAYKAGVYDRIKPKTPLGKGGIGAVQVNLRYDWLDLNNGGILGGRQQMAGLGVTWMPTDYVRFLANYGRLWIDDAAVAAGTERKYQADAISLRAQFDF
jgi:phosphate-selective porin OprO and OprP